MHAASRETYYNGGHFFTPELNIREFRGVSLKLRSTPEYSARGKVPVRLFHKRGQSDFFIVFIFNSHNTPSLAASTAR